MPRRYAAANDKAIFRRTAQKTKTVNVYPMSNWTGTRM